MIGEANSYGENSFVTGNKQENISLKGFGNETSHENLDNTPGFGSRDLHLRRYCSGGYLGLPLRGLRARVCLWR